jgi:hypothetical protein
MAMRPRKNSEDKVSIPTRPRVRCPILTLLSQIHHPYERVINANFRPAMDMDNLVRAISELISIEMKASQESVVEFDLNPVTVDLGSVQPVNKMPRVLLAIQRSNPLW